MRSLIYTLKNPQILHISTKLSIEGKDAIYSIFVPASALSLVYEQINSRGLLHNVVDYKRGSALKITAVY